MLNDKEMKEGQMNCSGTLKIDLNLFFSGLYSEALWHL